MSRLTLSQDQIEDINSFLDNELASCMGEDNSMILNSSMKHKSQRSSIANTSRNEKLIPGTENLMELQNKIDLLEQRMFTYAYPIEDEAKRSKSTQKRRTKMEPNQFFDVEFKNSSGKKSKLPRVRKKRRSKKGSLDKSGASKTLKVRKKKMRGKEDKENKDKLDTSRSYLHSAGKQKDLELLVVELQKVADKYKNKLKGQRKKTRVLKKENIELQNFAKKLTIQLKKYKGIENDYQVLLDNFEESEKLRLEQRQVIDQMRVELKRNRNGGKRKNSSRKGMSKGKKGRKSNAKLR